MMVNKEQSLIFDLVKRNQQKSIALLEFSNGMCGQPACHVRNVSPNAMCFCRLNIEAGVPAIHRWC